MECKAKLEFMLPEQELGFKAAVGGLDLGLFITGLYEEVRRKTKYSTEEELLTWRDVQQFLNVYLNNSDVRDLVNEID